MAAYSSVNTAAYFESLGGSSAIQVSVTLGGVVGNGSVKLDQVIRNELPPR